MSADEVDLTNTSIGEAAFCVANNIPRELVSFSPSNWPTNPISVGWVREESTVTIDVTNHTTESTVVRSLESLPPVFNSWPSLKDFSAAAFHNLLFTDDAFVDLYPLPYHPGVAERIQLRLAILNQVSGGFNDDGEFTDKSKELLAMYFAGKKGWFSDSKQGEVDRFESKLTFPHPFKSGEKIVCRWHGKVKTPQLRIHFSWPIVADFPVYVPYVGPKITKR